MGAIIGGIPIGGFISTTDDEDEFATHSHEYGKGGAKSADTLANRDLITELRRDWGMLVSVFDDPTPANNKIYILRKGLVDNNIANNANFEELEIGRASCRERV